MTFPFFVPAPLIALRVLHMRGEMGAAMHNHPSTLITVLDEVQTDMIIGVVLLLCGGVYQWSGNTGFNPDPIV
jgi:hypothetical protein